MADLDRDDKADIVIYRPSDNTWNALLSGTNYGTSQTWSRGAANDRPVAGDYDGDGWNDIATYRPSDSSWHIWGSATNYGTEQTWKYGLPNPPYTDIPEYVAQYPGNEYWPWPV